MLKNERSSIIKIVSKQGYVLNKFKDSNKIVEMAKQLGICRYQP